MNQQTAYNTWCNGQLNKEVIDFWNELKSMNSIELSQLVPFFRLSAVDYTTNGNGEIKEILPYQHFDFLKTELQSPSKKGFYDIDGFELEVSGTANSIYKGVINLKLFDLNLIEDKKLKRLISLGSNIKIDFGWNKWDWGEISNLTTINNLQFHAGKGHTLFAVVSGREIGFNNENIMEITINFTSATFNIMNNKKIQNLVEINWDEVENIKDIHTTSQGSFQWFRNFYGKLKNRQAIKIKDLLNYLTTKILENNLFNSIVTEFDTNIEVEEGLQDNIKSLDPNILLDGNTIGDFFITLKLIDKLYNKSTTYKIFLNNILESINKAYSGDLQLELIQTPKGNESVIKDEAESTTNLWGNRNKYLKLEYGTSNSLIQDISFSSDLDAANKNLEININTSQINGATPSVLKNYALTWLYTEEQWNEFTDIEKDEIINKLHKKQPDKMLNVLLESTDFSKLEKDNQEKAIKDIKTIVKNQEIRNNSIRYMPFTMSVTLFGISDIWTGTNIYFDENFIIPIFQNTIWSVTNMKHNMSIGEWNVTIDCKLKFRKKTYDLENKINQRVKSLNLL